MSLLERGLAKLTISAWKDREGKMPLGKMSAMYNPETIQLDYQARYRTDNSINSAAQSNHYTLSEPVSLNLTLLFDSQMPGNNTPVEIQLAQLKTFCAVYAATESPSFLRISWGKMRWENKGWFAGRASALTVDYTLFDRDATPLRATARLSLVADESFVIQQTEKYQQAPDNALIDVPDMASLSQLALGAGASIDTGADYLALAMNNDMDHLDDFSAGSYLQTSPGEET